LDPLSTAATTRHQRRRQETADRIVEAGAALFGERGVEATTVADICERADIAHQTFFNHFPTKQDLVREIARIGHDFFVAAIETAAREGRSTGERLARLFASIHEAAAAAGPMHRDLVSETMREAHSIREGPREREIHRAIEKLVRRGRAEGDVTRLHASEDLVALIFAAFHQLMFEWAHRADFPIAERSTRMARLLADALAPRPAAIAGAERAQRTCRKQARTSRR
jgi:AcrR family transcriptional regulator